MAPRKFCEFLSVNLKRKFQQCKAGETFSQLEELVTISAKKTHRGARDRSDAQEHEHGERMGATAMARPTCAGNATSPPAAPRRQLVGGFAARNGGFSWHGAFAPTKMTPEKLRYSFFRGGKWTKSKRRGSFSGRGNDRTNIIKKHS